MSDQKPSTPVEQRPIPCFSRYRASKDGHIWSCLKPRGGIGEWHKLSGWRNKDGYQCVDMIDDKGKQRSRAVHVLILETFVGPRPHGMEACHEDGQPQNNWLGNLRWDTHQANMHDAIRHGTFKTNVQRGSNHGHAKLTETNIPEIRKLILGGARYTEIAKSYGVARHQIYAIARGKTWSHVAGNVVPSGWKPPSLAGSKNGRATINENDVSKIKAMLVAGRKNADVARQFGVSALTICKIYTGLTWRHVPWPNGSPPSHRPHAKLTAETAAEIRRLSATGMTGRELARRFGVCPQTVSSVLKRKIFKAVS